MAATSEIYDTLYLITFKCKNCGNIITAYKESQHKCIYCGCNELSKPAQDDMFRIVKDYHNRIIK